LTAPHPLDVLLINPGNMKEAFQALENEFTAIETPSLAALFATYQRKKGLSVDILDAAAFGLGPNEVARWIVDNLHVTLVVLVVYGFQPSASTQNMPAAGAIARELKTLSPGLKIMMTGTHPAALPLRTLEEEAIDFVCDGEGPETIHLTAQSLGHGGPPLSDIPNLWYRDCKTVRHNPRSPLMRDLDDTMPAPALDLLPMERYRAHNWHCFDNIHQRKPYASLHTSLGCPYRCSFCCINAPFGGAAYRMWSPETVLRQIDSLVRDYGVCNIKFVDEMFVLNRRHVEGICRGLIERDYDLNIWAYARVDSIKPDFLELLAQAGFRWLALGIESGSEHVRDGVEKGRFGTTEIIQVVRDIQDAGMYVIGNYIFGLPDDTPASMQQTLELALEADCEFANFYAAMAYPGSRLYDAALEQGLPLPETWLGYSQHSYDCRPLPTYTLSAAEVLRFRDEAFMTYYTNKDYLSGVRAKFGEDVVEHIKQMTQIRLPRKLYGA
jgi:anaerobic magnesium-protoporphyrin IX monomethyl ester cyclase